MLKTVTICRSVYPLRFILLLGILFSFNVFAKQSGEEYIIERENWKAFIRLSDGTVDQYEFREHGKPYPFATTEWPDRLGTVSCWLTIKKIRDRLSVKKTTFYTISRTSRRKTISSSNAP